MSNGPCRFPGEHSRQRCAYLAQEGGPCDWENMGKKRIVEVKVEKINWDPVFVIS